MKQFITFITLSLFLLTSCIKDEAPNPEADILALEFPANSLRVNEVEIYNDYIVAYPLKGVNLKDSAIVRIDVSEGATYYRTENTERNDTLFFIVVTSESKKYTKTYPVIQMDNFPVQFGFENWVKPSTAFLYENPKEDDWLWYSSNNGTAIAWNSVTKSASEYPVRKTVINGSTAAELTTMEGPGEIAGGITFIPCLAGSLYLGGFNALTGLTNPLRATTFGVPFNSGKPVKLSGYYKYTEGSSDYILSDGGTSKTKKDTCSIYSVIYKTDGNVKFLYGDNVENSPNIVAKAQLKEEDIRQENQLIHFEVEFDYASYSVPFSWDELRNNEYKLTIVFASSKRGKYYEGRPGSTLIVDDVELHYITEE